MCISHLILHICELAIRGRIPNNYYQKLFASYTQAYQHLNHVCYVIGKHPGVVLYTNMNNSFHLHTTKLQRRTPLHNFTIYNMPPATSMHYI
jgi:hypothetical protein